MDQVSFMDELRVSAESSTLVSNDFVSFYAI